MLSIYIYYIWLNTHIYTNVLKLIVKFTQKGVYKTSLKGVNKYLTLTQSLHKFYIPKKTPKNKLQRENREEAWSGWDLLIVDEGVHEQALLDALPPFGPLRLQVLVGVVGHDHGAQLVRQLHDEAVVVAHHPLPPDAARRREHQDLPLLQLRQDVLVWNIIIIIIIISTQSCMPHCYATRQKNVLLCTSSRASDDLSLRCVTLVWLQLRVHCSSSGGCATYRFEPLMLHTQKWSSGPQCIFETLCNQNKQWCSCWL